MKSHLGHAHVCACVFFFCLSVNPGAQLKAPGVRTRASVSERVHVHVHVKTGLSDGLHADIEESRL